MQSKLGKCVRCKVEIGIKIEDSFLAKEPSWQTLILEERSGVIQQGPSATAVDTQEHGKC